MTTEEGVTGDAHVPAPAVSRHRRGDRVLRGARVHADLPPGAPEPARGRRARRAGGPPVRDGRVRSRRLVRQRDHHGARPGRAVRGRSPPACGRRTGGCPVAGIPRMVRPRKRWGTVYGFSVVDVGGNWLRISKTGDREAERDATEPGLSRGRSRLRRAWRTQRVTSEQALKTLVGGLERAPDAPALERGQALLYRAELEIRLGRTADARASLEAAEALDLDQAGAVRARRRRRPRHRAARRRRLIRGPDRPATGALV